MLLVSLADPWQFGIVCNSVAHRSGFDPTSYNLLSDYTETLEKGRG